MDPQELEILKQQAQKLKTEIGMLNLELQSRLSSIQEHFAQARHRENQLALDIRLLKVRQSCARVGPCSELSDYYQRELVAKQQHFAALQQRHAEEAQSIQAEQSQLVARCQVLIQRLQALEQNLLQWELMGLIHP